MPAFPRVPAVGAAVASLLIALTACVPEPDPTAAPSDEASVPSPPSEPDTPTPLPTSTENPTTSLPASCDDIYSDAMRARLERENPPLNDPGVTLLSTQQAPLLELLDTLPTLRCSWGPAGEKGLSTNVSIVGAAQADYIRDALVTGGFACDDVDGQSICRVEQRGVTLDDVPFERGEVQALRGEVWVTTSWITFDPEGYTEDILATVAG